MKPYNAAKKEILSALPHAKVNVAHYEYNHPEPHKQQVVCVRDITPTEFWQVVVDIGQKYDVSVQNTTREQENPERGITRRKITTRNMFG